MPDRPDSNLDWEQLFARYETMAVGFARGLVGDADLARDLYQEAARATFERASSGGITFESPQHVRNYLFQALRNLASDTRKKQGRAPGELVTDPVDPASGPGEALAIREGKALDSERLQQAFATLPDREQQAVTLRYLRGYSYAEIQQITGKSISTLQARVEAGLARLRLAFGKPGRPQ